MARLAVFVELVHALALLAWVVGLPLLLYRRWPRLSRWYALYAIGFVVTSQLSHHLLGECFLTTLARHLWQAETVAWVPPDVDEWFTVRLAKSVFGLAPSRRSIVIAWEIGVVLSAVGAIAALRRDRVQRRRKEPSSRAGVSGRETRRARPERRTSWGGGRPRGAPPRR